MITLVIGGARSGKSRYAERLAEARGGELVYVATAEAFDDEMGARIASHRARRGARWRVVEAPRDLGAALRAEDGRGKLLLVDCITLWLSNLMLAERDAGDAVEELTMLLPQLAADVVLVSNEVGMGIVPDNALARRFRDTAGLANQRLAEMAHDVVLVTAGLPMMLKTAKRQ